MTFEPQLKDCETIDREAEFVQFYEQILEPFWQERTELGYFVNHQGLSIHYATLLNPNAQSAIVISPGRIEGYLKYQELAYDVYRAGYSVFIIDHQGQGLSQRRLDDPHKGYVEDFQDYVRDFHLFIKQVIKPKFEGELHLLAHSMGCAIGLRYIQQHPHVFSKASFSSPMWGFRSGLVPEFIAKTLVAFGQWFHDTFKEKGAYFVGGQGYEDKPFLDNELTNSEVRYRYFRDLYRRQPQLQLGGITFAWLNASITGLEMAYKELDKVRFPIQVFQAERDTVIDNQAQDEFCRRLAQFGQPCFGGRPEVIRDGKHELFMETDEKRQQVLTSLFAYLNS